MSTRDETLQHAMALHRAGDLAGAGATYQAILAAHSADPDAMHLLGVIADAQGDPARAIDLIGQALQIRDSPRFHSNLGMALGHLGRHHEAVVAYNRALQIRPAYPEALNNLGTSLEALGRPTEAAAAFRRALALRPEEAPWWGNLGNALRAAGDTAGAEAAYRQAVALGPAMPVLQAGLGQALRESNRPAEAEAAFRAQLALHPDDLSAQLNLAAALGDQGRANEAAALLPAIVTADPSRPEAHHSLATALRQLGRLEEAEAAARQAVELRPDYPEALSNLGSILREQGRLAEAEPPLRKAIALRPGSAGGYNDLAIALTDGGRVHEALAVLELAASLAPGDADTRHHRALLLLLLGRMAEGWAEYEARFETMQGRPYHRAFTQSRWRGEALSGRTILLHGEQGLGDTIQFCRYAALVAAAGGRVVLEVQRPLLSLLAGLTGVSVLVGHGDALPAFDLHCPLLSLPLAFGTTLECMPAAAPYLAPAEAARTRWRARLPAGPHRIGLVWAGNPRHINDRRRSLPFAALAPLWDIPDVAWHSLQVGARSADLEAAPSGLIDDLAPELTDYTETAAAIEQMAMVVTVDTSVAHVAGALGRPCLLLLPYAPDWRWLRGGMTTGWYPSLRLMRQGPDASWMPVVSAVAQWLKASPLAGSARL